MIARRALARSPARCSPSAASPPARASTTSRCRVARRPASDAYHVTVEFADVLDLVPQSSVKVNDVTVGAVDKITLKGWHAEVTLRLRKNVHLPDNAVAELQQTSLLGEKYVSLAPPTTEAPEGRLGEGDTIPLRPLRPQPRGRGGPLRAVAAAQRWWRRPAEDHQRRADQRHAGHESDIQGASASSTPSSAASTQQKGEIVRAIDGLDRLSARLAAQKAEIATALDDLGPGLKVLADQRAQLTRMLTALSDLGRVGTRVINASRADTVANLRALQPILGQARQAGDDLPNALRDAAHLPVPADRDGRGAGRLHQPADHRRPGPAQHPDQPQRWQEPGPAVACPRCPTRPRAAACPACRCRRCPSLPVPTLPLPTADAPAARPAPPAAVADLRRHHLRRRAGAVASGAGAVDRTWPG